MPPHQLTLLTEPVEQSSCGLPEDYFRANNRIHAAQI
jgi:hypothetical protein